MGVFPGPRLDFHLSEYGADQLQLLLRTPALVRAHERVHGDDVETLQRRESRPPVRLACCNVPAGPAGVRSLIRSNKHDWRSRLG